jgi:dTDP-4-amino-4,6-dideoxygalactose transaminase
MTRACIPLSAPCITQQEIDAVVACLEQGKIGSNTVNLEKARLALQFLLHGSNTLLTTSCTASLELALRCLNLQPDDEVILPSFTFVSCANAVLQCGGKPVLVDIDDRTLNIDLRQVEGSITDRTRAIMPVHYAGISCDMEHLLHIAQQKNLHLVEDAAHAIGALYKGSPLGTLGTFGCFSFHDTKNVTSGEGGALAINDSSFIERAEIMYEKGTNRKAFLRGDVDKYTWIDQGSSYTLSAVLAALLTVQLQRAEEMNAKRGVIVDLYKQALQPLVLDGRIRFTETPSYATPNHHLAFFLVEDASIRDPLLAYLKESGIGATFHYIPLHSAPFAMKKWGYAPEDMPVSQKVANTIVRLPLFPQLALSDVEYIASAVRNFFAGEKSVQPITPLSYGQKEETCEENIDLSLVLPCYQEETLITKNLQCIIETLDNSNLRYEIILIDDKSRDHSADRIREASSMYPHHRIRTAFHNQNRGRGATVSDGIHLAKGQFVGFIDIDLEVQAHYIAACLLPLQRGEADVVIVTRHYPLRITHLHRIAMSVGYRYLVKILLGIPPLDTEAGYKFFVRGKILPIVNKCRDPRWFWDTEIAVRSYDAGLRIHSPPVLFMKRQEKETTVKFFRDSWRSLTALLRFRKLRKINH